MTCGTDTLPAAFTSWRCVASELDDRFEPKAGDLFAYYLGLCMHAEEMGLHLIAWEMAKAAAHWKTVSEDRRTGAELMEVL